MGVTLQRMLIMGHGLGVWAGLVTCPPDCFFLWVGHPPLEPPWNHSFQTMPADPPDLLHCPRKRPIYGLRTAGTVLGCLSTGMNVVLSRKVLSLQFSLWSRGQGLSTKTSLAVYCVYARSRCREALKPAFMLPPYALPCDQPMWTSCL